MTCNSSDHGGLKYLDPEIIWEFSQQQYFSNRRGLGWDKPADYFNGPTSNFASLNTFGHTGFTGTAAWADPEFDLIYVFLSNRTFPNANNRKLIENNIRTRIQDLMYQSIWDFQKYNH